MRLSEVGKPTVVASLAYSLAVAVTSNLAMGLISLLATSVVIYGAVKGLRGVEKAGYACLLIVTMVYVVAMVALDALDNALVYGSIVYAALLVDVLRDNASPRAEGERSRSSSAD